MGVGEVAKLSASDRDWQAEQDLRTLIEAEQIKMDTVRLKACLKKKKEMKKALESMGV